MPIYFDGTIRVREVVVDNLNDILWSHTIQYVKKHSISVYGMESRYIALVCES